MLRKLFRQVVRFTYPWLPLTVTLWRILRSTGGDRQHAQARFWKLYSRINFANWLEMAIDLARPEFWV